jgi:hypothetical protein
LLAHRRAHSGCDPEGGAGAVPACGFADCTRAASDPARPVLRPDREELAAGERNVRSLSQKTRPEAEPRPQKPRRVPRWSAERRARPAQRMTAVTRIIRGARRTGRGFGCSHPKRRCGLSLRAARRSAPLILFGAAFVQWLGKARAQTKCVARTRSLILTRDSGGGGPREARWRGRCTQRVTFVEGVSLR